MDSVQLSRAFFCGVLGLAACSEPRPHAPDAGQEPDSGRPEAPDAGAVDAGPVDAGPIDAGAVDAGPVDAGPVDAGSVDAGSDSGITAPPERMHGIEARVDNTTCFLNGTPPLEIVPVDNQPAFGKLDATGALAIVQLGGKLGLLERSGRVRAFASDGDGSKTTTVLDLRSDLRAEGLRGVALRPDGKALFATFVPLADPLRLELVRFDVDAGGVADPDSLDPLLTLPLTDDARAGGALAFLFDGTLVVAFGDGGDAVAGSDPLSLAGKLLRLDVTGPAGYAVPSDNPFLADADTADEIYATGLGAPTSCTVDRVTGRLWCADAGGATHDQILHVSAGLAATPILSFARGIGCGALVGYVSRDASLPDIEGALVFGDACSDTLSALRFDGSLVRSQGEITTLSANLSGFGQDARGRILAVDVTGKTHALVRDDAAGDVFPASLSATGCIEDMATRRPAPSLVPFEVRAPLWSDGAKKRRFIVLPAGETIGFTEHGSWEFPVGTMFMKEFLLDADDDESTPDPIMETRFLIRRTETSWEGYSYMWDPERQDAFLLEGAEIGRYAMVEGEVDDSGASVHRHTFPDRAQCLLCHNPAAGRALGLQTGRMNTNHDYDGFVENQLRAMDYAGLFTEPLPKKPDALPRFADPSDESAELEDRARASLYANCAHCHTPGGPTPVALDLRYETPLAETNTCGITPDFLISQIPDADIIMAGDAAQSELFFRLSRRDQNQMPPIATLITEPVGVEVVREWIDSLTGCP